MPCPYWGRGDAWQGHGMPCPYGGAYVSYDPTKHHRKSIRMAGYDYSQQGAYFVTVCTDGGEPRFGVIRGGAVVLSEEGSIAAGCWAQIPQHFPATELDEFSVMPDHMHGIVLIHGRGTACRAPTTSAGPLGSMRSFGQAVPGSLPTIVGSFKSAVTREARAVSGERVKVWQRGYWEHVIRDEEDYNNIVRYILGNPAEEQLRRDDERAMRRSRNSALARRWLGRYHP